MTSHLLLLAANLVGGWNPTSFAVGLSIGGAAMLAFLVLLCWAQGMAEQQMGVVPPARKDLENRKEMLVQRLKDRAEAVKWTE